MPRLLLALALGAIYLATRLWRLESLPMFVDEGTYIGWALQALHATRPLDTLVSVTDGKQPLLPWLMLPLLGALPDRLLAARLTAVAIGGIGLEATYWLTRQVYGVRVALLAACLYAGSALTFFYDRIALYDGLIAACGLSCLAVAAWWWQRPSPGRTIALGFVMGLTLLTKVSAIVIVGAAPLVALVIWPHRWRQAPWALGAYAIAGAIFGALLFHPQAAMLFDGTSRYAFTAGDLAAAPTQTWGENLRWLAAAIVAYLPAPLWWFYAAGFALPLVTRDRRDLALLAWCLLLLSTTLLANKVFYFRYYVPGAVAGLILCARTLWLTAELLARGVTTLTARSRTARPSREPTSPASGTVPNAGTITGAGPSFGLPLALGLLAFALIPSFGLVGTLWRDPRQAALPSEAGLRSDQQQYVLGREAGWEADKIAGFLLERSRTQDIVVLMSPLYGNMRSWVGAQVLYNPRVHVVFRTQTQTPLEQILSLPPDDDVRRLAVTGAEVYVAVSEWSSSPTAQPLIEDERQPATLVADFPRDDLPWRHRAYRLHVPPIRQTRFDAGSSTTAGAPTFGGQIALTGYDLETMQTPAGTMQRLTFYWRAPRRADKAYSLFVHVVAPGNDGDKIAQQDGEPGNGFLPTDRWQPGETIEDRRELTLPPGTPCGAYPVLIGWYDRQTFARLPVTGTQLPSRADALELTKVAPASCPS